MEVGQSGVIWPLTRPYWGVAMEMAFAIQPNSHKKHRNTGYFDQNNTVRHNIPNLIHFEHKANIIANKVRKLQLLDDW